LVVFAEKDVSYRLFYLKDQMGFKELSACILDKTGMDISCFGRSFVARNIEKRIQHLHLDSEEAYLKALLESEEEANKLTGLFQVNYSEFFRNPFTYSIIEHVLMPGWLAEAAKQRRREIRIWSVACASGQEPYSLAIIYDTAKKNLNPQSGCRIFATDVNTQVVRMAKEGIYSAQSLANVSLKRINEFFTKEGDNFRVLPKLREYIDFSVFDILAPHTGCPPASVYGGFDAVICANFLFYYNEECQRRILQRARQCLLPGGVLITGEVERDILKTAGMREIIEGCCIFC
jgi:chemotaxis methyl-accepting protein methylase